MGGSRGQDRGSAGLGLRTSPYGRLARPGTKGLNCGHKGGVPNGSGWRGSAPRQNNTGGRGGEGGGGVPGKGKWTGASGAAVVLGQIGLAFWWEESPSNIGA